MTNPLGLFEADVRAFMARFEAEHAQRLARLTEVAQSETFARMVAAMTRTTGPRTVDAEGFAYFPNEVRKRLSWEFASDKDVSNFFAAMANKACVPVEPGSERDYDDEGFYCEEYQVLGLTVTKLHGQGTMICVQNKAAVASRHRSE